MVITRQASRMGTLLEDLKMIRRAIRMGTCSVDDQAQRLYELFPDDLLMTERTRYHNMGYWTRPGQSLDDASEDLALLLAERTGFQPGDRVLDAGYGNGDQDFLWMERYRLKKIVGLNVTPRHAQVAQQRSTERGLTDRIDFRIGSATEMDVPAGSVDRVVALESAFHFVTRDTFFHEAYRVLRPGGTLGTADVIAMAGDNSFVSRKAGLYTYAYPEENRYGADEYERLLRAAGFVDVRVLSIRDKVYAPWSAWMEGVMEDPAFQATTSKLTYKWLHKAMTDKDRMNADVAGLD